jgi:forkhead box protein P
LAESGRKQLEQLMQQIQEQLQINLLQQTHMMQACEKAQNKVSSSASASALQQLQIQQQQLISQLQIVQQRILMVRWIHG